MRVLSDRCLSQASRNQRLSIKMTLEMIANNCGAGLFDMALTAQHATSKGEGEIFFLAVIKVMAASATHTSIE